MLLNLLKILRCPKSGEKFKIEIKEKSQNRIHVCAEALIFASREENNKNPSNKEFIPRIKRRRITKDNRIHSEI